MQLEVSTSIAGKNSLRWENVASMKSQKRTRATERPSQRDREDYLIFE